MTQHEYETLASFRYELRKFLHFSRKVASAQGLAPQQYLSLLEIKGFPQGERVTVGKLAERLHIAPHSAVGLVDRLEEHGYVKRTPSEDDRRCVYVSLTTSGEEVLAKLAATHRAELQSAGPLLTDLLKRLEHSYSPRSE